MPAHILAAVMLSVAAYIHTMSADPMRRPANVIVDLFWRVLSFVALCTWALLVLHTFFERSWTDGAAALFGSFAVNWWFGHRGPKPAWPLVSILFGIVGLGLAVFSFLYR